MGMSGMTVTYGGVVMRYAKGLTNRRCLLIFGLILAVRTVAEYWRILKRQQILVDQRARRTKIEQLVARLAKQGGGQPAPEVVSHGLLDEVTHLVERPVGLIGEFDPRYLELPREVLLASMAKYQRVFAVEAGKRLVPRFVAILDGKPRRLQDVRQMMERILNARLADSLMFWKQDHRQLPLDALGSRLTDIVFQEQLGSMADKTRRLRALSEPLAVAWQ